MKKRFGLWYHGWNIIGMCVISGMSAIALTINCASLFLPDWTREFGVPVSTIALGVTLFSITTAAFAYLIGSCAGSYPARRLIGGGLLGLGIAHLLVAMAQHVWQVLAIYMIVLPFAVGFCGSITSQALISRWFERKVGLAMGLTASGLALPGILFPAIIIALLPIFGWRALWGGFGAIILLIVLPAAMLVLRDRPDPDDPFGYITNDHREAAAEKSISFGEIVRRRNFWVIMAAFLSVQFIPMTIYVNITPIVVSYGGGAMQAGLFLSIFGIAALSAKLGSGWLADRAGNRLPLAIAAMATGAGAMLLAVPDASPAHLIGVAVATGLSGATWTLLASSLLAEFGQASFGRAYGLGSALAPFATFAAPVVARLEEMSGSYAGPLITLGVMAMASALAVLLLFRRQAPRIVPRPA